MDIQTYDDQRTPNKISIKKVIQRPVIIKLSKVKYRILRAREWLEMATYKGMGVRL